MYQPLRKYKIRKYKKIKIRLKIKSKYNIFRPMRQQTLSYHKDSSRCGCKELTAKAYNLTYTGKSIVQPSTYYLRPLNLPMHYLWYPEHGSVTGAIVLIVRPPDIVCRRTYIFTRVSFFFFLSFFFFSPPDLQDRWTELNENRPPSWSEVSVIWKRMSEIWDTPPLQIGAQKSPFLDDFAIQRQL